jgi:hypothetical protein
MINVKEAVEVAQRYFSMLYEGTTKFFPEVEEVELTEDEQFWVITLGYSPDFFATDRKYKTFKINSATGEVISMKIRTLN